MKRAFVLLAFLATPLLAAPETPLATGDLGVVIERATGSLLVIDRSDRAAIGRIEGLGDLSHASMTYSPDERFAYVFGRDGGLTKVDMIAQQIVGRTVQAGNSIGGAISDDGKLVAVSNYEPGGVKVFDADTLALIADIPADGKTIGLVARQPGRGHDKHIVKGPRYAPRYALPAGLAHAAFVLARTDGDVVMIAALPVVVRGGHRVERPVRRIQPREFPFNAFLLESIRSEPPRLHPLG